MISKILAGNLPFVLEYLKDRPYKLMHLKGVSLKTKTAEEPEEQVLLSSRRTACQISLE